jgi:hypothetical protein
MTLNATVNPDFSQVEADSAQLAVNTQFALFFPEKRPFFLEGADLFETRINAVYTRTIADPSWGIKLTGKEGKNAFGAIVARDTRTNLLIPSSQGSRLRFLDEGNTSTILRYRRDLAGAGSAMGGIFTSREGTDYHNRVLGLDALYRWGEGEALRIEVLGSDTLDPLSLAHNLGEDTGTRRGHAPRRPRVHPAGGLPQGLRHPRAVLVRRPRRALVDALDVGSREHLDLRQRRQSAAAAGVALFLVQRAEAVVRHGLPRPRRQLLRRPLVRP